MTLFYLALALIAVSGVRSEIVELSCSDNALCINSLPKNLLTSLRERKTVRLFDILTIEPRNDVVLGRSNQGAVAKFLATHALSFDVNDQTTLKLTKPTNRNGVLSVEVFEGREAADVKEVEQAGDKPKGSADKVEKSKIEKTPKRARRRGSKRVMEVIVPLIMGMKSASTVLLAIAAVAYLTIKAFMASKLALAVTLGMAAKRIYDSFGPGVGLNHPYLYSQYPLDFSGASSHAYVSGVGAPHFAATPEMYGPTALASHTHQHEMLQQSEAAAQQGQLQQQASNIHVVNATRATERWDGKSKLLNLIRPFVDKIKEFMQPIAGTLVNVMPETIKGFTAKALGFDKMKQVEEIQQFLKDRNPKSALHERPEKKEYLVPRPRVMAKSGRGSSKLVDYKHSRPKKILRYFIKNTAPKHDKDLTEYYKTKKYHHNYAKTHYYPRLRHYTVYLPQITEPNANTHMLPHSSHYNITRRSQGLFHYEPRHILRKRISYLNRTTYAHKVNANSTKATRIKRSVQHYLADETSNSSKPFVQANNTEVAQREKARSIMDSIWKSAPVQEIINQFKGLLQPKKKNKDKKQGGLMSYLPETMYLIGMEMVYFTLGLMDVFVNMSESVYEHVQAFKGETKKKSKKKLKKKKNKFQIESSQFPNHHSHQNANENEEQHENNDDSKTKRNEPVTTTEIEIEFITNQLETTTKANEVTVTAAILLFDNTTKGIDDLQTKNETIPLEISTNVNQSPTTLDVETKKPENIENELRSLHKKIF